MKNNIKEATNIIYSTAEAFIKTFFLIAISFILESHIEMGIDIKILLNISGAIWVALPLSEQLIRYCKLLFAKGEPR